ncbi:hypothetical protein C2S53_012048 [Perilla frutescens var. hirtella]|uniref:Mei2-like C-terminal RNA recognition motif domain-containing protein n=1 Tax=Perilla frutescens var. hirtella TaxID=608512 RepID=A0AAD4PEF0_PERFH|nr:hypothetical protein C2S53_012048 [Perilla frutescens var. hirtella]
MCITSCKNSPFLKPKTPLNPRAKEWRPPHHFHPLYPASVPPPPPQTAAQVVALDTHSPLKLQWQLSPPLHSYHPVPFHHCFMSYGPLVWPHIVHHSTPFYFPATHRLYKAAPPLLGSEEKHVVQPEEKCLGPIVKDRNNISQIRRAPPISPPLRRQWKPRKTVSGSKVVGGAVTSPSRPKKVPATSVIDEKLSSSSSSSRTTVMIRNIPNQLRRDFMLEFVDAYCNAYSLEYDFMYLPMDFCKKDNLGYAFVNFTSGGDALKFKEILDDYKWGTIKTEKGFSYTSKKICVVTWAKIQGKERLMKRFKDTTFACNNPGFLPVAFDPPRDGSNTTLPVIVGRWNKQIIKGF